MQLQDAWVRIDGSPIEKQEIGECCNYAETMFLSSEDAIEHWGMGHLGVELCDWA